ncbi:MAG: hypothetical protein HY794_02505 [Desulfarculus sp.]|nr:hypothetical protein [Desulfarculus sp.]
MKILVCLKQVPEPESHLQWLEDGGVAPVPGARYQMSALDAQALEWAVTLAQDHPGVTVEAVCVGGPRAAAVLERARGMGAAQACHILAPEGADPPALTVAGPGIGPAGPGERAKLPPRAPLPQPLGPAQGQGQPARVGGGREPAGKRAPGGGPGRPAAPAPPRRAHPERPPGRAGHGVVRHTAPAGAAVRTHVPANLVVMAHAAQGALLPSAAELLGLARRLAGQGPTAIKAILVGQDLEAAAREMAGLGLEEVVLLEGPGLNAYSGPAWARALTPLLAALGPAWVLVPHDSQGQDYAPVLSLGLEAACLGPVEGLEDTDGGAAFLCPGQGGKVLWPQRPLTPSAVLSVAPGAFPAAQAQGPAAPLTRLACAALAPGIRHLGETEGHGQSRELAQAQSVLALGRGLGKRENLALAQDLAACLGACLAGSRPLCDLGWLSYDQQVGQTGATVAPRLYLACGISGARQHTLGMRGAGFIVAINHDPQAPMHDLADLSVVADLPQFLQALLEACRAIK